MNSLKLYQVAIFVIIGIISCLIFISFFWTGYATITNRPGLNGDFYIYYNWMPKGVWIIYNFSVSLVVLVLGLLQIYYIFKDKSKMLNIVFIAFSIFLLLLILIEFCLNHFLLESKG